MNKETAHLALAQIEQLKQQAGVYALNYINDEMLVGIGTGSTVKYFIAALATKNFNLRGVVSSSAATSELLKQHNIALADLNSVGTLDVYIDGADAVNQLLQMIKGGGAALTREKIVASASKKFICIVDSSKTVDRLGSNNIPVPVEVIPMARSYVAREIVKLGGIPNYRQGVITDNGNVIIDVYNLDLAEPIALEEKLDLITGVVANGIFAKRSADELVIAQEDGIICKKNY